MQCRLRVGIGGAQARTTIFRTNNPITLLPLPLALYHSAIKVTPLSQRPSVLGFCLHVCGSPVLSCPTSACIPVDFSSSIFTLAIPR
ncbi:hypothetical protein Pcinc_020112 [Petrolisthes cinctipes]|uniref:Uncharacterized protein n=1 Tax=Petrolisthes cinctipes TaxID=88211 RepID=A0AAE1FJZ0_PETCI|nr:hypothetical protein Pcinc_020112 [Petrolisthes cinctipes]